jgi:hypothetical protein
MGRISDLLVCMPQEVSSWEFIIHIIFRRMNCHWNSVTVPLHKQGLHILSGTWEYLWKGRKCCIFHEEQCLALSTVSFVIFKRQTSKYRMLCYCNISIFSQSLILYLLWAVFWETPHCTHLDERKQTEGIFRLPSSWFYSLPWHRCFLIYIKQLFF